MLENIPPHLVSSKKYKIIGNVTYSISQVTKVVLNIIKNHEKEANEEEIENKVFNEWTYTIGEEVCYLKKNSIIINMNNN